MLQKEIVDQKLIRETSLSTGETFEFVKNVFDSNAVHNNINHRLDARECSSIINKEFGNFIAYFYNKIDKIDMPNQYKMRFIYLSTYLDYDSNELVIGNQKVKEKIKRNNLASILGLSKRETLYTIKELISHNLIIDKGGVISINSDYAKKGSVRRKKQIHTRLFITAIRDLYSVTKSTNHKQLYYFFKIIPYVHTQKNIITKDIHEESNEIVPMDFKEVCSAIGLDYTKSARTYNSMLSFKVNGEFVFSKNNIGDVEMCYINPRVYYGGTNPKELTKLIEMFDVANYNTKLHD